MDNIVGPHSTLRMIIDMLRQNMRDAICTDDCEDGVNSTTFALVQWGKSNLLNSDRLMINGVTKMGTVSSTLFIPDFFVTAPEYGHYVKTDDRFANDLILTK